MQKRRYLGICMACRRPRRHRTRTASTTTSFSTHCLEPYVNKEQFVHKVECANKRGRGHQHPPAVNKVSRGDVIHIRTTNVFTKPKPGHPRPCLESLLINRLKEGGPSHSFKFTEQSSTSNADKSHKSLNKAKY